MTTKHFRKHFRVKTKYQKTNRKKNNEFRGKRDKAEQKKMKRKNNKEIMEPEHLENNDLSELKMVATEV